MTTIQETETEALNRIQAGFSQNDMVVINAFAAAGVPESEIIPRENVLTFRAWKAKDRRVAKGATSIRVQVWIPTGEKDENGKEKMIPRTACLFHVSQTVPADAPKRTRPEAWENETLVKPGTYEPETATC